MDVAWPMGLEGAVPRPGALGLHPARTADAVAPQASTRARSRYLRVQEPPHDGRQTVQRQLREPPPPPPRQASVSSAAGEGVAPIPHTVAVAPPVNRPPGDPVTVRRNPGGFIIGLDRSSDPWCGGRFTVRSNRHPCPPSRMSPGADRATESAKRRGSM